LQHGGKVGVFLRLLEVDVLRLLKEIAYERQAQRRRKSCAENVYNALRLHCSLNSLSIFTLAPPRHRSSGKWRDHPHADVTAQAPKIFRVVGYERRIMARTLRCQERVVPE
jgi:hypothetical protein